MFHSPNRTFGTELRLWVATVLFLLWPLVAPAQDQQVPLSPEERSWLKQQQSISLGVGVAFPPFMWVENEDGQTILKGMVSDYIHLLSERLNLEMDVVLDIPFNEALERGKNRQIDFFPCISRTPERSEFLLFSEPYLSYPLVIVTREDAPSISDVEDLRGKRIAAVEHLMVYSKLHNEYPDLGLNFVFTKTVDENLDAIATGMADACIINVAAASYFIQQKGLTNLKIAAPVNWQGVEFSMGIRDDWPIFKDIIEKALGTISQEEKDRISQRWITVKTDMGIESDVVWRWSLGLGGAALLFFAVFFIWNRRLQREIKHRKRAEKSLLESEENYRSIFNESFVGIYVHDSNGDIIDVNDRACEQVGYSRDELLGMNIFDLHNDDADTINQQKAEILQQWNSWQPGTRITVEAEHRKKDGSVIHVGISTGMIHHSGKHVILALAQDITERKNAEISLQASEERYRSLVEGSIQGVLVHADHKPLFVNQAWAAIHGYTPEEVLQFDSIVHFIAPDDRQRLISYKEARMAGKTAPTIYEYQGLTKDGSIKSLENRVITINWDGCPAIQSTIFDITERKRLEEMMRQAQKMESIGTLAGGIAHDFNNILSSIIGFTELALDDVEEGSQIEEYLREVDIAGKRAKNLVKQMLTFARQPEDEFLPVQIGILAKETLKLISPSIPSNIDIRHIIASDSFVSTDPSQAQQMLVHLYNNALHAMENTGGVLEVSVKDVSVDSDLDTQKKGLKSGNYVELSVSDSGSGIAPEIVDSIFEPYFSTRDISEGRGMGLAFVHGIVESSGGKVEVSSTVGEGSEFRLYLPVLQESQSAHPHERESVLPGGTERILLVDDEVPIVEMSSRQLEDLGYSVTTSNSSLEALELFRSRPEDFDLVITDMVMPHMSGDKLAAELVAINPDIPVILCTGYTNRSLEDSAAKIGIREFIYKPLVKADMAEIVRQVLDEDGNDEH